MFSNQGFTAHSHQNHQLTPVSFCQWGEPYIKRLEDMPPIFIVTGYVDSVEPTSGSFVMSMFQRVEGRPFNDGLTLVGVLKPGGQWPDATQMPNLNDLISISGKPECINRQRIFLSVDSITYISQEASLSDCQDR